jgi:Phage tail tube protein
MTTNAYALVGSGISTQIMFAPETEVGSATWGVYPGGGAGWRPLEFKSETLALKKTTVQGQGLHAGGLFDRLSRRVLTNYDAGGTITFDLPNRNLNALLRNMTGSPNNVNVGVAPGNVSYVPQELTVSGSSITSGTSGAYISYHQPGSTGGISLCIQKGVASANVPGSTVVEPFTYVGCKISDWEISVETGAIVQCSLTFDARNELGGTALGATNGDPLNSAVPALIPFTETGVQGTYTTAGFTDPLTVFHFREATLTYGGTPSLSTQTGVTNILTMTGGSTAANVRSSSFKETHALDTNRYFLGSSGFKAEQLENGFRKLSGSFVGEFLSAETYYAAFAADTTTSLVLTFVGGTAGTSGTNADTITITFPNIKLDGESPMISGPGVITENVTFTGLDDNITAPYQITYISSDAAE